MSEEIQPTGQFSNRELSKPGDISAGLMKHLAEKFPPEKIVAKIEELLEATHVTAGNKVIPDNRAREAALKMLVSYLIGLPVLRQEIVTHNVSSTEDMVAMAKASPAMQAALRDLLAKVTSPPHIDIGASSHK